MQWIPAHCDIKGNEEADRLSKEGSKATQEDHPISYSEAKTLLRIVSTAPGEQDLALGIKMKQIT